MIYRVGQRVKAAHNSDTCDGVFVPKDYEGTRNLGTRKAET